MKHINKSYPVTMSLILKHFIYFYASVSLYKALVFITDSLHSAYTFKSVY